MSLRERHELAIEQLESDNARLRELLGEAKTMIERYNEVIPLALTQRLITKLTAALARVE